MGCKQIDSQDLHSIDAIIRSSNVRLPDTLPEQVDYNEAFFGKLLVVLKYMPLSITYA